MSYREPELRREVWYVGWFDRGVCGGETLQPLQHAGKVLVCDLILCGKGQ